MDERVVIVGAGHAGFHCAAALRRLGSTRPVLLIGAEEVPPYDRPPLSKAFLKGALAEERLALRPAGFYAERGIDLILGRTVVAIAPAAHRIRLADGEEITYGTLVLATGARPRRLPEELVALEHGGAERLLDLRTLADARRLKTRLAEAGSLLVIGGGYIGLEVASAARELGLAVTVIEAADMLMPRLASPPASDFFARRHAEAGVTIHLGARLVRVVCDARGVAAELGDGTRLEAELALVGIGAEPADDLARQAGIAADDGVPVDARLRTDAPDVLAVGDVARLKTSRWGSLRLESIQNATESAEVAARVIAGDGEAAYDPVPWFWTEQFGVRLQSVGLAAGAVRRILRGRPEDGAFSVLHLDADDRLLALDSIVTARDFMQAKKLIASGLRLDPARAGDPAVTLKDAVRSPA
ncbi:MAG: pyridine nucleotide-disulfide oxidoreductase [Rhodothalassiaceae bacterium]|nr:MAG: pyridine nucleotide-disulfide oxidoreductase [Rhodothalassiaceae bacterium]